MVQERSRIVLGEAERLRGFPAGEVLLLKEGSETGRKSHLLHLLRSPGPARGASGNRVSASPPLGPHLAGTGSALTCSPVAGVMLRAGRPASGGGGTGGREARGGGARERPDLAGCWEAEGMGVGGEEGSLAANEREDLVSKGLTHSQWEPGGADPAPSIQESQVFKMDGRECGRRKGARGEERDRQRPGRGGRLVPGPTLVPAGGRRGGRRGSEPGPGEEPAGRERA